MDMDHEHLKELARKYLDGNASPEEKHLLHQWYDTVNPGELEIVFSELAQDIGSFRQSAWVEMQARMKSEGASWPPEETRTIQRIIPWRRWAIAACCILLIGLVVRWLIIRPQPGPITVSPTIALTKTQKTDAAPGGNRAILTLDDGRSIVLDSANKGALATQGSTQIVKLDDGKIAYHENKASAPDHTVSYNVMSTPRGGQYELTLPDGTRVWLNAASSIRYPTAFTGKERRVDIQGEVYFEVAANASQPFIVGVNKKQTIEVLGTHFNVNAYQDETSINTTLITGSVRVRASATAPQASTQQGLTSRTSDPQAAASQLARTLKPGQQAQLDAAGAITLIEHPDLDATMAWKNGYFSFDHSDIATVMRQLSRWYDMDVEFRGTPTHDVFGGDIRRSLPLSKVLHILQKSQVHFSIEEGKIIVMP